MTPLAGISRGSGGPAAIDPGVGCPQRDGSLGWGEGGVEPQPGSGASVL